MRLSEFDFDLPDDLIATRPAQPRSSARMLLAQGDEISDRGVMDLPTILKPGDRLVLNDTKVIPARLAGTRTRDSGQGPVTAQVEVTLLEPGTDGTWTALAKPLRKLKVGEVIQFSETFRAMVSEISNGQLRLSFETDGLDFEAALDASGSMPLPPYIAARRAADAKDRTDYQTVWAKRPGAIAAPTASLHFDDRLLSSLAERGVETTHVTLHVGAGTFLPVKVDDIREHKMHAERGEITQQAAEEIAQTKAEGGRVIAGGTTALRLIETAARAPGADGRAVAWSGDTDLFITPGFTFHVADGLMTNFHLPKSTLMMLVAAWMGKDRIMRIYDHAIKDRYRFFSYGDSSLLLP